MQHTTIHIQSLAELPEAARQFVALMGDETVYAFYGEMGAGKTTFIRELAKSLGVTDEDVNSPSFSIINEYRSDTTAELIYHFDLYRLDHAEQLEDTGLFDLLGADGVCVIEWGEQFADEIGDARVDVFVTRLDAEAAPGEEPPREVRFVVHDIRGEELIDALVAETA